MPTGNLHVHAGSGTLRMEDTYMDARNECTRDAATERMLDKRLTGIVAELTRMVARAERNARTLSLPGAEDDIERARR